MNRPAGPAAPAAAEAGIRLRRMRWWDIPGVILLEHLAFPEDAWSIGMFWSELAEATSRYYVVAEDTQARGGRPGEAEPRIVGYAGLLVGAGEAEVLTIAVDPARAGRGLGARLLTELMREAVRRRCDDVVLEVRVDNERAQKLYERFGFVGIGLRKGYYQPAGVDALVMRSSGVIRRFGSGGGDGGLGHDGGGGDNGGFGHDRGGVEDGDAPGPDADSAADSGLSQGFPGDAGDVGDAGDAADFDGFASSGENAEFDYDPAASPDVVPVAPTTTADTAAAGPFVPDPSVAADPYTENRQATDSPATGYPDHPHPDAHFQNRVNP